MLQELFLVLDKLKKKDAEKFLIPAYVSKYLSMESRQIYARYQKGRHHLDIDGKENRLPHEPMLEVEDQIDRQEFINSIRAAIRHNLSDFEQWLVTERFLNSRTYKEILEEYNKGKDRTKRLKTISVFHSHVTAAVEKLRLVLKPIYMKHLKSIHNHDVVLEKEEAETPESGIFAIAAHLPYTCPEIPLE